MKNLRLALDRLAIILNQILEEQPLPITCAKRCSACCYEPVYVSPAEAALIVQTLEAEGRTAQVRDALRSIVRRFQRSGLFTDEQPEAVAYRRLMFRCPLLATDGTCSVYEVRPAGCRMHATYGPREACEDLAQRPAQPYINVMGTALEHPALLDALRAVGQAAEDYEGTGGVTTEHLIVLLAEQLGIPTAKSGARHYTNPEGTVRA